MASAELLARNHIRGRVTAMAEETRPAAPEMQAASV